MLSAGRVNAQWLLLHSAIAAAVKHRRWVDNNNVQRHDQRLPNRVPLRLIHQSILPMLDVFLFQ
jgi:hypothetical protein